MSTTVAMETSVIDDPGPSPLVRNEYIIETMAQLQILLVCVSYCAARDIIFIARRCLLNDCSPKKYLSLWTTMTRGGENSTTEVVAVPISITANYRYVLFVIPTPAISSC